MWFIGFEVEQETSAPLPKKNPGSAPEKHAEAEADVKRVTPNPGRVCSILNHKR